jgi:hypothetical protein
MDPNLPLQPNRPQPPRIDDIQPPRPFSSQTTVQQSAPSVAPAPQPVVKPITTVTVTGMPPLTQSVSPAAEQIVQDAPRVEGTIPPINPFSPPAASFDTVFIPEELEGKTKKRPKLLKRFAIVFGSLLLVSGIGYGITSFILNISPSKPIKISSSELILSQQNGYSYLRPSKWVDATSQLSKTPLSGTSLGLTNFVVYADTLKKDSKNTYSPNFAYIYSGQGDGGTFVPSAQFATMIKDPSKKAVFEQTINTQFTNNDSVKSLAGNLCDSIANTKSQFQYNTASNFEILVTIDTDCIFSSTNATKLGSPSEHLSVVLGFTETHSYELAVTALKNSWDLNSVIYNQIIASFKGN